MNDLKYFDIHSHLQFSQFDSDRENVIARMREDRVGTITIGTGAESSKKAVLLAEKYDFIYAGVGAHPTDVNVEKFDKNYFVELANNPKVVAIGECGLDYFRIDNGDTNTKEAQKELFRKHIEIAIELGKPLMIHCRDAYPDLLAVLDSYSLAEKMEYPGNVHFFSAGWDIAQKFLERGFTLSFGGPITFPPKKDDILDEVKEVIRKVPLDKIMAETDSPFVSPQSHRGKRNEPVFVKEIVSKIAEIRREDEEFIGQTILFNSRRAFGW